MKKRLISILLAAALAISFVPSAFALGSFADVDDPETARNVEVLRLMGVLEGDGTNHFHPQSSLTRAEFCKMAVVLTGNRSVVARYGSRTVFPDVKATHWSAGYVNYAASAEAGLIHGAPDGNFWPDRAITYGEAVAILTRLLGYTDADTGGIWPAGYIALAGEAGMTKGLHLDGNAAITRAQAAKLFVNALSSKHADGTTMLSRLGLSAGEETVLYSVDLASGKLRTKDGEYQMVNPMPASVLLGLKGRVVTDAEGRAVTFLPSVSAAGGTYSDAAIIVDADGSTAGFSALTGGVTNYAIYRNGVPASASALRKNDVVIYNASGNAILACDTRVEVVYESCDPNPTAPTSIEVLGGTRFSVMPAAQQSLAELRPGREMTILLAADGRVAAVSTELTGNALAYVGRTGSVCLICAADTIELNLDPAKTKLKGNDATEIVTRISQSGSNGDSFVYLVRQSSYADGDLDLKAKTVGSRAIAEGAVVLAGGVPTDLAALSGVYVERSRIAYIRLNAAGAVDLIALGDGLIDNVFVGRATVTQGHRYMEGLGDEPGIELTVNLLTVDCGSNPAGPTAECAFAVNNGDYVSAELHRAANGNDFDRYTKVTVLDKLSAVSASAWIGDSAVNYGSRTYVVYPDTVLCWNRDSGRWFVSFAAAKAYGGTMDLYVLDGVVRVIEVHS